MASHRKSAKKKAPAPTRNRPAVAIGPKGKQGRPRADTGLGKFGFYTLVWPFYKNWLTKKGKRPRGLQSRMDLWNAIPNQRRYFFCLANVAFTKPGYGDADRMLCEVYATSPDLTLEALLYLRVRASDLKRMGLHRIAMWSDSAEDVNRKMSLPESDLRRRMRKAHADFMARTAV